MIRRVLGRALHLTILLWGMVLAWSVSFVGLRWLYWRLFRRNQTYEPLTNEALVRELFEVLGPTFIKLGQIIASSPGPLSSTVLRRIQEVPRSRPCLPCGATSRDRDG